MPDLRSIHFKSWSNEFEKNLTGGVKFAYEQAEKKFEEDNGTRYYSSFESFKSARSNRRKARKEKRRSG